MAKTKPIRPYKPLTKKVLVIGITTMKKQSKPTDKNYNALYDFVDQQMIEGDIEKGHRKLYVQTGNGRIPVTILNKLSKELYGIPNWYTLDGQDGNAGQTVVMEALNRKGTEGYKFSEGGSMATGGGKSGRQKLQRTIRLR